MSYLRSNLSGRCIAAVTAFIHLAVCNLSAGPPCDLPSIEVSAPVVLNTTAASDVQDIDSGVCVSRAGSTCVAVWAVIGAAGVDQDLYVSRSTDHGLTWSPAALLNSNAAFDSGFDSDVVVRGDGAGTWVAVWWSDDSLLGAIGTDNDILFTRSTDDGVTWSPVTALNAGAASDTGSDIMPRLEFDGAGVWLVVWRSNDPGAGTGIDYEILFTRSIDGGQDWSAPAFVNEFAATDGSSFDADPIIASTGGGEFVVAWPSSYSLGGATGTEGDIHLRRSVDGGATWLPQEVLNDDAAMDTGVLDTWASIASDSAGNLVAAWARDLPGSDLDVYRAFSSDSGATWSSPALLSQNGASDLADDIRPFVMYGGSGLWVVTWSSIDDFGDVLGFDEDVIIAVSSDGGDTWSKELVGNTNAGTDGEHNDTAPWLALAENGDWILAWDSTSPDPIDVGDDQDIFRAIIEHGPAKDCNADRFADPCQIRDGMVEDDNRDGVPDECQQAAPTLVRFRAVALDGETTPAGGTYSEFMSDQCNGASQVVYSFRPLPYGLAVWDDGEATLIAASGMQAPGTPVGVTWSADSTPFSRLAVSKAGPVAFAAGLHNQQPENDQGIWCWDGEEVSLVAREGDQLDNVPRGIVWSAFESSGGSHPRISPEGVVAFTARVTGPGVTPAFDTGIWKWQNDVETLLVQEGTPAPGAATTFAAFGLPQLDATGKLAFHGAAQGNLDGIWYGAPGNLQNLVLEGQQAIGYDPGVVFSIIDNRMLVSEDGHVVFRCVASGPGVSNSNNETIWRHYGGVTELVAADGAPAPGLTEDSVFVNLLPVAIAPNGKIVISGTFDTPSILSDDTCLWVEREDGFHLVVREGEQAPGADPGHHFAHFNNPDHVAMNSAGEVLFQEELNGLHTVHGVWGWAPNRGLFAAACIGSDLVSTDDEFFGTAEAAGISGYDTGSTPGPSSTLNDEGDFSVGISYDDGVSPRAGFFLGTFPEATDFNNDGVVDEQDHVLLCAALGTSGGSPEFGAVFDLNQDGAIDHLDQAMFESEFEGYCLGDVVTSSTFAPPPDGFVDAADLAVLLGEWGDAPSCSDSVTSATFASPPDGIVDAADLAALLGGWGECD